MTDNPPSIEIFSQPHPFSDKRVDTIVPAGGTLSECLELAGFKFPEHVTPFVFVDDILIERSAWRTFTPHSGQVISISVIPAGGGGGKNVLRAVAMIGVLALSVAVPGLIGVTGLYGTLVAAGVGLAGALAVNALIPPASATYSDNQINLGGGPNYQLTGVRNRALPYGSVPVVFGKHKIYPPLAAVPYTERVGDDSYLRMLFCIGTGTYNLSEFKIGDTDLSTFDDYEIEEGRRATIADLYPYDVSQTQLSIELLQSVGWNTQTTPVDTTEIIIDLDFPTGLWQQYDSGKVRGTSVTVEAQYRPTSGGSWTHFPGSPKVIKAKAFEHFRKGFRKKSLSSNQYDVRVQKTTPDYGPGNPPSGRDNWVGAVFWTSIKSVSYQPPVDLTSAYLVALRVKASGQLKGVIDQFNCIAERVCPIYNAGWYTQAATTRNPAWIFAEVLRGAENKRPVQDERIDSDALEAWALECDLKGFKFDAIIDSKTTVLELLKKIAAAGRATFGIKDNKYTVIRDLEQTTPIQHFSQRNSRNLKGRKSFVDYPHAIKAKFRNEDAEYIQDEIIVYWDGYDSGSAYKFETMDFYGVTTSSHVWKLARYHMADARLRPETWQIETDVEHIVCTRGDLVRLTHDVILVGLGAARVKARNGNDITLDDSIVMEVAKTYGAQIRKVDGTFLDTNIVTDPGEQTVITLGSASGVAVGDMIFYGESGAESIDCMVTRIEPGSDMSARLTLVDNAPGVRTADGGTVPTYTPIITKPAEVNRIPPKPSIVSATLGYFPVVQNDAKIDALHAVVNFSVDIGGELDPASFIAEFREVDETDNTIVSAWQRLPLLGEDDRFFLVPVENDLLYDFRIRSVGPFGQASDWDTLSLFVVTYSPIVPDDIAGLDTVQTGSTWYGLDCEISWTAPADEWRVVKHVIEVYKTTPLTLLRTEYVDGNQTTYSYSYFKNYQDNWPDGAEGSLTFRVSAIAKNKSVSATYNELIVLHSLPGSVTSLVGQSQSGGVLFTWDKNDDTAFDHFLYRVNVGAPLNGEPWLKTTNPHYLRNLTTTEKDTYGSEAVIYFQAKTVDKFGQESGVSSTQQAASALDIKPADIDDFAVTASKIFTKIPVVDAISITDDSPSAGSVAWNAHKLYYDGVEYSIGGGNTSNYYVYWKDKASTYSSSNTHPAELADWTPEEDFIIAINDGGAHQMAWNSIANQVIGSAFIQDLAVSNAKISDLHASKITSSSIIITGNPQPAAWLTDGGALATQDSVDLASGEVTNKSLANLDSAQNTKLNGIEAGADVTASNTAAGISNQGSLATKNSVNLASGEVTNKSLANLDSAQNTKLDGISTGADVTSDNQQTLAWIDGSAGVLQISSLGSISLETSQALTVEAGADMTLKGGSDLILKYVPANHSRVLFSDEDGTGWDILFSRGYQTGVVTFGCTTIDQGALYIGWRTDTQQLPVPPFSNVLYKWPLRDFQILSEEIFIATSQTASSQAGTDDIHIDADDTLYLWAGTRLALRCTGSSGIDVNGNVFFNDPIYIAAKSIGVPDSDIIDQGQLFVRDNGHGNPCSLVWRNDLGIETVLAT